jgi:hypothetical protein
MSAVTGSIGVFLIGLAFVAAGLFGQLEALQLLKTPALSTPARIGSVILGLGVIGMSFFVDPPLLNVGWFRNVNGVGYVMDVLSADQQNEQLSVYIADKPAGQIVLDASLLHSTQFLALSLTGKVEQYRLEGTGTFKMQGKVHEVQGEGFGTIDLAKPGIFHVHVISHVGDHALLKLDRDPTN